MRKILGQFIRFPFSQFELCSQKGSVMRILDWSWQIDSTGGELFSAFLHIFIRRALAPPLFIIQQLYIQMTSFIQQPSRQEEDFPSTPKQLYKEKQLTRESVKMSSSFQKSLKGSFSKINSSNLKASMTLEERGLTYGKQIKSLSREEKEELRRAPKIDCSNGPSQMIKDPLFLIGQAYAEINPQKSIKIDKAKPQIIQQFPQVVVSKFKDSSMSHDNPQLINKKPELKKPQANSSAIRQKKYRSKYEISSILLLVVFIFLLLSAKNGTLNRILNEEVVPFYAEHLYIGIFE